MRFRWRFQASEHRQGGLSQIERSKRVRVVGFERAVRGKHHETVRLFRSSAAMRAVFDSEGQGFDAMAPAAKHQGASIGVIKVLQSY